MPRIGHCDLRHVLIPIPFFRSPPAGKRDRQTTRSASRARSISLTPPPQIAPIIPIPTYRPMHAVHALLDDDDLGYEWKPTSTGVELGSKEDVNDDLAALIAKARAKHAADAHTGPAANPTGLRGASSVSAGGADDGTGHFADRGIMLQLTISMRQDPVRAKVISERALKVYEKPRVFTIGSVSISTVASEVGLTFSRYRNARWIQSTKNWRKCSTRKKKISS